MNLVKLQSRLVEKKYFTKFKKLAEDNSQETNLQEMMSFMDILKIESSVLESVVFKLEPPSKEPPSKSQSSQNDIAVNT